MRVDRDIVGCLYERLLVHEFIISLKLQDLFNDREFNNFHRMN